MTQLILFDYQQLDQDTREFVQTRADNVRQAIKQSAKNIIDIGGWLIEVKNVLPHGAWLPWLQTEFGWSDRTARNFIYVTKTFKLENFSNLSIEPSALYLLAAPQCPQDALNEIIDRASNGEIITHKAAK